MEDNPFVTETYQQKLQRAGLDPDRREGFNNDDDDQGYSDGSDGSESSEEHVVIEDSVREDMAKLEQTVKGMGLKYRMIDRIGEGDPSKLCKRNIDQTLIFHHLYRHILNRLQGRRFILRLLSERLGHRTTGSPKMGVASNQDENDEQLAKLRSRTKGASLCCYKEDLRHQQSYKDTQ